MRKRTPRLRPDGNYYYWIPDLANMWTVHKLVGSYEKSVRDVHEDARKRWKGVNKRTGRKFNTLWDLTDVYVRPDGKWEGECVLFRESIYGNQRNDAHELLRNAIAAMNVQVDCEILDKQREVLVKGHWELCSTGT